MPPVDNSKIKLIALAVLIILLIGAGIWYWQSRRAAPPAQKPVEEQSLGVQLFERAQNPLKDELPQTNPFKAESNPFGGETNPFNRAYRNPFE